MAASAVHRSSGIFRGFRPANTAMGLNSFLTSHGPPFVPSRSSLGLSSLGGSPSRYGGGGGT